MSSVPRIAIIYLMYHSDQFVGRFIDALAQIDYPKDRLAVMAVDHPHPEHGSSVLALEKCLAAYAQNPVIPQFQIFVQKENKGFSAGVNVGISAALEQDFEYVFLHGHDSFIAPDALTRLVDALESDRTIGAAQALMLSYPETSSVNSEGGIFHYLGFGYIGGTGKQCEKVVPGVRDICYASGGAVLMRASLLRQYGLWDEDYFLYHEDIEYSLRLRSVGYRVVIVPQAVLYHEYNFGRNPNKWYFMERNRLGLLLSYYKFPTLALLFPVWFIVELGLICLSFVQGWFSEKMLSYSYWLSLERWSQWLAKRKKIQLQRVISDRQLLAHVARAGSLPEMSDFKSSFFKAASYALSGYLSVIRWIIRW